MPTTNDTRAIKINANNPAKVVDFDVNYSGSFTSDLATTFEYSDNSSADTDLTIREYVFKSPATGAEVGRVSIRVKVLPNNVAAGVTFSITGTSTTPRASGGGQQLRTPDAQNLRRWAQDVDDGGGAAALRDVAVVDVRSSIPGGTASQTIRVNDEANFEMAIVLSDRSGPQVSGTVSLATAATPGAGFTLGPVTITDREDGGTPIRTIRG
ncbi:MAG TPA: hypothetical protein PKW35_15425 [Nannocystaceae bacterium]|nr:hypothetical protein [Nannocystaceae bacterium]